MRVPETQEVRSMNAYWRSGNALALSCSSSAPGRDRSTASAQSSADFPKAAVELRGGVASPQISFSGYDENWNPGRSASLGVNFEYRPLRYLGLDVGVDESSMHSTPRGVSRQPAAPGASPTPRPC